jgi:hypothetical protein
MKEITWRCVLDNESTIFLTLEEVIFIVDIIERFGKPGLDKVEG